MRLGRVRFESKYIAIQYFYENKGWSIRWMCQQLDITRTAYYKWIHREIPEAEQENVLLAELIREYDDRFNHMSLAKKEHEIIEMLAAELIRWRTFLRIF